MPTFWKTWPEQVKAGGKGEDGASWLGLGGGSVRARRLDILADLARCGFCNVDLVFLDTDDIVLKYEAVRHNRLVYQAEDFDRGAMYSRVVRQYLDFLPYLKVQREAYKRRLLRDQG